MIKITRGLDLPILGTPEQVIENARRARTVALLGRDYVGMKPTMSVREGDRVKLGQALFEDKKTPGVLYTAPGAGVVREINRGERRAFLSLVIELDEEEEQVEFPARSPEELAGLSREAVVATLVSSGQWTALRTRPYSKVPAIDAVPHALFINAMDTNPLAADPEVVARESAGDFITGINVLSRLSGGKVFLCRALASFQGLEKQGLAANVQVEDFAGPHPAGLSGTHIHYLAPVSLQRQAWTINYQDVIAIGKLFSTGRISVERVVSLAGPQVDKPRLLRTRLGVNLDELSAGELQGGENRVISGSVLSGRKAGGVENYLGRYHLQVSVIREGRERVLLGYLSPGKDRHSALGIYLSSLFKGRKFAFTSATNGSARAMVPVGSYERVMPLDILPTQLLRSLIVGDIEAAQNLGALELDEEDLALCTYVCPGKYEYGPILRDNLTRIEKES
ncbi:MAG: Na(+)-translocating NADH-quinone reductase subunit A [Pseudomonadales bacterium]|nr:Na(+)-translocating NADH-quinone reductase subunit A [Pseudomonadales bacterium]MCP5344784.1 Na(+)-translocating NADH-quinone reductase subunit A [Pseudomonadales bacterium]